MNLQLTAGWVTAIAFSISIVSASGVRAQEVSFSCGTKEGIPATLARTPQGEFPLVLWNSPDINSSTTTPEQLCQEVSEKFQIYYHTEQLKYLTTSRMDGKTVVCLAKAEGEP